MSETSTGGSLWRQRDFMLFWSGQTVSLLGAQVTFLALPLIAITVLDASGFAVALLGATATAPWLLFALPAGVLADRLRKRPVMIGCDVGCAILIGSVPLAAVFDVLTLGQLFVVGLATGALVVLFDSAAASFLPVMLGGDRLVDGNAKLAVGQSVAAIAGPGIGGVLIGLLGAARTMSLDALSYGFSAIAVAAMRVPEPAPAPDKRDTRFRDEIAEGLRLVRHHPVLRTVTVSNAIAAFASGGTNAIWILYVVRELGWSAQIAGLAIGIGSVGALVGSLLATPVIDRTGMPRALLITSCFFAPCELVLVLVSPGLAGQVLVIVSNVVLLAATLIYNTASRTIRQLVCPPELLGRMNGSIRFLQWGALPLGGVAAAGIAAGPGLWWAVLVFAVLAAGCPLVLWSSPLRTETAVDVHRAYR